MFYTKERMRRKRHKSVYDMAGVTSLTKAENAIKKLEILDKVKVFIME